MTPMTNPWCGVPTPEADWLAGLLAADGNVNDRALVSLTQSGDEGLRRMLAVRAALRLDRPLTTYQPKVGALVHGLSFTSREAAEALATRYGITPRKSLTLRWPDLPVDRAAAFLRGYVEGDGCVAVYPTPTEQPYLHISFVGTPAFVEAAVAAAPGTPRIRQVGARCSITEARYNGRQAREFGAWLFAAADLPGSAKVQTYRAHVATHVPRWERTAPRRAHVLELLASGNSLRATAAESGVAVGTICRWKKERAS